MLTKNATSWSFLFFLVTQPEILPIINLFELKKNIIFQNVNTMVVLLRTVGY